MYITAFFTKNGVPETGLTPTIRIRDLSDNSLVVTDAAMTEVGDGYYKYNFSGYDKDKDYAIRCDGGASLNGYDRYTYGSNRDDLEMSEKLPTNYFMGSSDGSNLDDEITGIKQKTDNLPASPAPAGEYDSELSTIQTDLDNPNQYKATGFSTHSQSDVWSVGNRELTTPNNYKADVSSLATSAELSTHDGKLDTVDSVVDSIKNKTDNLPSNTTTILNKILGIADENSYIDNYGFENSLMTGCRKRIYDSKANAITHGASGLLGTYNVTVTYSNGVITSYLMTLE